jgi:hypothetical protein
MPYGHAAPWSDPVWSFPTYLDKSFPCPWRRPLGVAPPFIPARDEPRLAADLTRLRTDREQRAEDRGAAAGRRRGHLMARRCAATPLAGRWADSTSPRRSSAPGWSARQTRRSRRCGRAPGTSYPRPTLMSSRRCGPYGRPAACRCCPSPRHQARACRARKADRGPGGGRPLRTGGRPRGPHAAERQQIRDLASSLGSS